LNACVLRSFECMRSAFAFRTQTHFSLNAAFICVQKKGEKQAKNKKKLKIFKKNLPENHTHLFNLIFFKRDHERKNFEICERENEFKFVFYERGKSD
jgi:hypothetical protein